MSGSDAITVSSLLCLALCLDNTLIKAALTGKGGHADALLLKENQTNGIRVGSHGWNRIKHGTCERVCICFMLNANE